MSWFTKPSSEPETIPIVQAGNPVLRKPADPVDPTRLATREMQELIDRMIATMRDAPGVGLAAPQVGVGLCIAVLEDREDLMARLDEESRRVRGRVPLPLTVLVNPEIIVEPGAEATFFEGCLSVRGYMALVARASAVRVRALDREGEPIELALEGWPARIAQHEIDHLRGTLYVDRMLTRSFGANDEVARRWLERSPGEVMAELGIEGR